MALKLKKRALPTVKFERDNLPLHLAPEGAEKCFIRIDAIPAGGINPEWSHLMEEVALITRLAALEVEACEDLEDRVRLEAKRVEEILKARILASCRACAISWETNIADADTDEAVAFTTESFVELYDIGGVPALRDMLAEFSECCIKAGMDIEKSDEETAKN